MLHALLDHLSGLFDVLFGTLKDQFIVDLQEQSALGLGAFELFVDSNHGKLNEISCAPLNGCVDGNVFGASHQGAIGVVDTKYGSTPSSHSCAEPLGSSYADQ